MIGQQASDYSADKLTRRVTFQQPVMVDDGMGGSKLSWFDFITVWASVDAVSTISEMWKGGQTVTADLYQLGVRYSPDLMDTRMRIVYEGRTMRYLSAMNVDQASFWIEITAQAEPSAT